MVSDNGTPAPGVLPESSDYRVAREMAWSELARCEPRDVAAAAAVELATQPAGGDGSTAVYRVPLLGEMLTVDVSDRSIRQPSGSELASYVSVLVLHYLTGARPGHVSDEWVTFRELEAGQFYLAAFRARSIDRLEPVLGSRPHDLAAAAEPLCGEPIEFGDAGVRIAVMPKVHVGIVVWAGDEELSPSVTILFGRTAAEILPTEDLAVVGGLVTGRLIKQLRAM